MPTPSFSGSDARACHRGWSRRRSSTSTAPIVENGFPLTPMSPSTTAFCRRRSIGSSSSFCASSSSSVSTANAAVGAPGARYAPKVNRFVCTPYPRRSCASQRYGPATRSEVIPSTPQPAFEPRSTIIRASIPVSVPSLRAPSRRWVTCADAGFVAWKSSLRVSTRRTGRRSTRAAPAASGSTSANFPPNAPPRGSAITRIRSSGIPNDRASSLRVTNEPCVLVETTRVPDGSSHAVAT